MSGFFLNQDLIISESRVIISFQLPPIEGFFDPGLRGNIDKPILARSIALRSLGIDNVILSTGYPIS